MNLCKTCPLLVQAIETVWNNASYVADDVLLSVPEEAELSDTFAQLLLDAEREITDGLQHNDMQSFTLGTPPGSTYWPIADDVLNLLADFGAFEHLTGVKPNGLPKE